jgi:hypothetical protein
MLVGGCGGELIGPIAEQRGQLIAHRRCLHRSENIHQGG